MRDDGTGGDTVAGILATGMLEADEPTLLVDVGTNGEIVIGDCRRMLCASTAAGPAFEGGRISMGMRATTGAVSGVMIDEGRFRCEVVGDAAPRGVCGSGLVDAVAAGKAVVCEKPLCMTLEEAGYDVEEAADGNIALQIQQESPVDLVITDIIMPEKEGIETITDLNRGWPGLPVIAISGGGRDTPQRYLGIAKGIGAARVFQKPVLRDELLEAIAELLAA